MGSNYSLKYNVDIAMCIDAAVKLQATVIREKVGTDDKTEKPVLNSENTHRAKGFKKPTDLD